jgi:hypothetical protein
MDDLSVEKRRVVASATPSGGDDLLGMAMDVDVCLADSDLLDPDSVHVYRTTDPERLIAGSCSPAQGVSTDAAAEEIERIWNDKLRYPYFEHHELSTEAGMRVLEFVTQTGPTGIYVTGRIGVHEPPRDDA